MRSCRSRFRSATSTTWATWVWTAGSAMPRSNVRLHRAFPRRRCVSAAIPSCLRARRCSSRCARVRAQASPVRMEARAQAAGLRLLRPQHPCGQGRGLHRMPRPRRPDAADAPRRLAADGLVHRLPPRSGNRTCATLSHVFDMRPIGADDMATRADAEPPAEPATADRLLDLPSMNRADAMKPIQRVIEIVPSKAHRTTPGMRAA